MKLAYPRQEMLSMNAEESLFRPPPQETMLLDLVQRLGRHKTGRTAVHLHFSKLSTAYYNERFLRIAKDSFATFVSGFEGQLFQLDNNDIFFLAKDVTITILEAVIERIRLLFSQDPILEQTTASGGSCFCTFYDLANDYDQLLADVTNILAEATKRTVQRAAMQSFPQLQPKPVQPDVLSRLEQSLENVDVTNLARRQIVCTLTDKTTPQPLFEEVFVSIEDLQTIVAPGVDLASNTWLFRYLTQTLDRRIMLMLIRDGVSSTRPFSLNLNVSSILTPTFAKFEAAITPQLKGRLVIEMNALDVFSDMSAYLFARDYLHDHGFRLCLDGLTHHTLPHYNRSKLGFDLIKLYWTPNAIDEMLPSATADIRNLVMETGQAHTILCRCNDDKAIDVGQDLGIVMFQGRHVDKLMTNAKLTVPSRF